MTTKVDSVDTRPARTLFQSLPWKPILLLIALGLLLWLGVKGWRVGRALNSLLAQRETAAALLAGGLTNIDPDKAENLVLTVRQDFIVLRDETALVHPLLPHLGWVPKVGPLFVSSPQLLELADAGTETAVHAVTSLKPVLLVMQSEPTGAGQLPQLIRALDKARPGLAQASQSLEKVVQARAEINNLDQFPQQLQSLFALADEWLPIGQDSLVMVQILPDILGVNGRRTYLLLAQNEDELRATGGFISGVGTLTVENGDIQSLTFEDASTFDTETLLANSDWYDYPPQPLYELMGLEYLLLRDTNYWPDFPYSAQTALEMYERVEPVPPLDGVIAIDQEFMSLLVAATGPVQIPESNTTITAQNTVESFRNAFNILEGQTVQDWLQNRKAFLLTFATAVLNKVRADFGSVDPIAFIKNIHLALNARHLQLYMVNPQEAAVLDQLNWDGRLENPDAQDFLLVLDTNMGYNKSNMFIERSYTYDIALNPGAASTASLTVEYTHTKTPEDTAVCEQGISYANAPNYQVIADRCYFNYLRIYTPAKTTLIKATAHQVPGETLYSHITWQGEATTTNEFATFTTFANFFMVPRGEQLTTTYDFQLPPTIIQQQNEGEYIYTLWLRKQAGQSSEPIKINVTLPDGSSLLHAYSSSAAAVQTTGNTVAISLDFRFDTQISIHFSR